ncbi:chaplin [Streptomyces spinoverrucosus]|uniref:chaplin n=1 Tax=Streptomyces spinoverrucosus TaxID=284043 RepID=UPI0018C3B2E4|nr:chaplin [Streptomyces spinoverrucosus]MBG0856554.1 chaplin [Streptomyces spinoverrucosus]
MRQGTRKGLMTVAAATGVIAAASGHAHADSGASGSSSNSPGVLSGNTVQAPVHVPVNVCGNTISVVGILNPAVGNSCANQGGGKGSPGGYGDDGYGGSGDHGSSGAHADGHADGSPGIGSGNHIQAPVHVPVNVCGNSVNVIGVGNAAVGNDCVNGGDAGGGHTTPPGGGGDTTPPETPDNPGNPGNPEQPGKPGDDGAGPDTGVDADSGSRDDSGSGTGTGNDTGSGNGDRPGASAVTQFGGDSQLADTGSGLPMGAAASLGVGTLLAGAVLYRRARASA